MNKAVIANSDGDVKHLFRLLNHDCESPCSQDAFVFLLTVVIYVKKNSCFCTFWL